MRAEVAGSPEDVAEAAGYGRRRVRHWQGNVCMEREDGIADEVAVALVYNGEPHAVMMCTPRDLEDFALGFSLSESVIATADELLDCQVTPLERGLQLAMRIPPVRQQALLKRARSLEGRSGCGICGTREIDEAMRSPQRVAAGLVITPGALRRALRELRHGQALNLETGAVHAAAWASASGEILHLREDVGRHNALDKLIGALARERLDTAQGFVVLTSRASYEMVMKSASAGIPLVAAVSAPTLLAIDLADEAGITLVGFARDDRFTVYSRPGRLRAMAATGSNQEGDR